LQGDDVLALRHEALGDREDVEGRFGPQALREGAGGQVHNQFKVGKLKVESREFGGF
jgi:hypothetical protein